MASESKSLVDIAIDRLAEQLVDDPESVGIEFSEPELKYYWKDIVSRIPLTKKLYVNVLTRENNEMTYDCYCNPATDEIIVGGVYSTFDEAAQNAEKFAHAILGKPVKSYITDYNPKPDGTTIVYSAIYDDHDNTVTVHEIESSY